MRRLRRNHTVEQSLCVSEPTEVVIPKGLKDEDKCDKESPHCLQVPPR